MSISSLRFFALALTLGFSEKSLVLADDATASKRSAYFIGNSVTDTIRYGPLAQLAKTRDIDLTWGRQMIPGAPLEWLYQHPDDGFNEEPYGGWQKALAGYSWDIVSIQPFDRHLHNKQEGQEDLGDVALITRFANLAKLKNPKVQVYIYARWPRITYDGKNKPFDKNDYDPAKPGSGNFPGWTNIHQFYKDGIHLNEAGSYAVAWTYFATFFKQSPLSLTSAEGVIDQNLAGITQKTAWNTVIAIPATGVGPAP